MRAEPTDAEALLRAELRNRLLDGQRFSRQVRIGRFIVDFACRSRKLVIELDGSRHADTAHDAQRTRWPTAEGCSELRSCNDEVVYERGAVLDTIFAVVAGRTKSLSPGLRFAPADLSPAGRRANRPDREKQK